MVDKTYLPIIDFCQELLEEHGDSAAGMGWKAEDADIRYRVMLDLIQRQDRPCSLLDFGCGSGRLLDYIRDNALTHVRYHGMDQSERAIELCRSKFPQNEFRLLDVLDAEIGSWPRFDYIVMNGILTYKGRLSQSAMFAYCRRLLPVVFDHARVGVAFNVMSKLVDWERDDLFHLPMDRLTEFLSHELSRHFVIRADYGLYEYTVYLYREPSPGANLTGKRLIDRG